MKIAIAGYGVEGKSSYAYWNTPEYDVTIADERVALDDAPEGAKTILGEGAFDELQGFDLVIDALFGIGLQRPIEGLYSDWIAQMSATPGLRLALDIPSGLDADTGRCLGPCNPTLRPQKPGQLFRQHGLILQRHRRS